jgi:hypothetical protein
MNTRWYTFHQNNSFGTFRHEPAEGIGYAVIVEATSARHANERAEQIGLYFNGCRDGTDCACCGDRWYTVYTDEGKEFPMIYSTKVRPVKEGEKPLEDWGIYAYMHKIGGEFFAVAKEEA